MNWKIWIFVPVFYALFSAWYFNWGGPLTQAEIDTFMSTIAQSADGEHSDPAVIRRFLEEDDGGEFVMLNLVQLHEGEIPHPLSGVPMSAAQMIGEYFGPFALALFKRGGHPVFQARTVGGNIDSWNAEGNVGFSTTAMMRYKSRRDLIELVTDPAFADSHIYKLAAIERTISYPTHIMLSINLPPPVSVLLVLLLLACVAQIIVLVRKGST